MVQEDCVTKCRKSINVDGQERADEQADSMGSSPTIPEVHTSVC